jgi:adenylate kinase family enzyme
MHRPKAILLIGPTGSGKSPLGAMLEKRTGWAHFDFGHELRLIARGEGDFGLTDAERQYVKDILHDHALFPDDKFPIVEKILTDFIDRNSHAPGIILNGLPRHIGQTEGISQHVEIKSIAVLECSMEDSVRRVADRLKGLTRDHAGRRDDTPKAHEMKFVHFTRRTGPLIDHYEGTGVNVFHVPVGHGTCESDIASAIIKAVR